MLLSFKAVGPDKPGDQWPLLRNRATLKKIARAIRPSTAW
jgi:hypothetical protein